MGWRLCGSNFKESSSWTLKCCLAGSTKAGYFGVIAMILIVAAALCWGLAHV
jgi:hypothetical protein